MKTILIIVSVLLIFCSCSPTVRLAKNDEKAAIQIISPTKAAVFVTKENIVAEANSEKHTNTANRLYNRVYVN
jgi:hypothetical protein